MSRAVRWSGRRGRTRPALWQPTAPDVRIHQIRRASDHWPLPQDLQLHGHQHKSDDLDKHPIKTLTTIEIYYTVIYRCMYTCHGMYNVIVDIYGSHS